MIVRTAQACWRCGTRPAAGSAHRTAVQKLTRLQLLVCEGRRAPGGSALRGAPALQPCAARRLLAAAALHSRR